MCAKRKRTPSFDGVSDPQEAAELGTWQRSGSGKGMQPVTSRTSLSELIERTRLAVLSRGVSGHVEDLDATLPEPTPVVPRVRVMSTPRVELEAPSRPSYGHADALLAGHILHATERRVFEVLFSLATTAAEARGYRALPSRVIVHAPAQLVALAVGITDRHLRRVCGALERRGLLAYGGHAAASRRSRTGTAYDGTLYAVKTRVDAVVPVIRRDDWRHVYRDLDADVDAGNTVRRVMSELPPNYADEVETLLRRWCVTPGKLNPVESKSDMAPREVVYSLGALSGVHRSRLAERVGVLASALAFALKDTTSRRFYCAVIRRAVEAEWRGVKALSQLQHAVLRVLVDVAEWGDLRRPGALLVARLKASGAWDAWGCGAA